MALEIVWTAGAERDLAELHLQLFLGSDENDELVARLLEAPLEENLRLLRDHPELAPRVRGKPNIRRKVLGYRNHLGLFYCVEKRGIIIHALLDLRQDPKMIAQRLSRI